MLEPKVSPHVVQMSLIHCGCSCRGELLIRVDLCSNTPQGEYVGEVMSQSDSDLISAHDRHSYLCRAGGLVGWSVGVYFCPLLTNTAEI